MFNYDVLMVISKYYKVLVMSYTDS